MTKEPSGTTFRHTNKADKYIDAYLIAGGFRDGKTTPLYRSIHRYRRLTQNRLSRREVLAMIKRRARFTGLPANISYHTFRTTGITTSLLDGGTLEKAPPQCNTRTGPSRLARST